MKHLFTIVTMRYDRYAVWSGGMIQRLDQPDFKPSGTWLFKGLFKPVGRGGHTIPLAEITPELVASLGLLYNSETKAGKYVVVDDDHGTRRHWGDRLRAISFVDAVQA